MLGMYIELFIARGLVVWLTHPVNSCLLCEEGKRCKMCGLCVVDDKVQGSFFQPLSKLNNIA